MTTKFNSKEFVMCVIFAIFSAIMQINHVGYETPHFGMWIDMVATSWVVALFLFGMKSAVITSLLGMLAVFLFSHEIWMGASMKWAATMCMVGGLYVWVLVTKNSYKRYCEFKFLLVPLLIAVVARGIIALPLNYFYAIPVWAKVSIAEAIDKVQWYNIFLSNIAQGIVDIALAWLIVFKLQLVWLRDHIHPS